MTRVVPQPLYGARRCKWVFGATTTPRSAEPLRGVDLNRQGLLLHLEFALDHVVITLLLSGVRTRPGGGTGVNVVGGPAGRATARPALLIEHLTERVRSRFELLDGALQRR